MSVITRMLGKMFPKTEFRALMIGLDASGRTTALYRMKLGEVVTTIPTIGFNVETLDHKGASFTVWDVGGCDKIRPLWRHYFQGTDALFFFVDSSDRDRFQEAMDELFRMLAEDELRDAPVLIYANKQDLPNAMTPAEIVERGDLHRIRHRAWHILGSCGTTAEGLFEGVDWLHEELTRKRKDGRGRPGGGGAGGGAGSGASVSKKPAESEADAAARKQEELLLEWLEREDEEDEEFLAKFADYTLDSWDHRTHLRIAWLMFKRHGRREGMPKIFSGIKSFIENSSRTKRSRGTTFHESMTYFWAHMVHFAMESTANPTGDFKGFLLLNPQLSNGGLFLHYYSKELMLQSPDSRTQVALPDKRPLPSLISSTTSSEPPKPVEERLRPRGAMDDSEFLERFRAKTLPSWGHEQKIRAIWILLREHGRERGGTNKVLDALQVVEGDSHHVTLAYFWLQMVTLCSAKAGDVASYAEFVQRPTSQQLLNPDLVTRHYSDRVLSGGAKELTLADKKPLPSVVR